MIDALLDQLFDLLYGGPDGPLLDARMALKPRSDAASHFIPAPRPVLSRDDMERLDRDGLMAELARVLDDLPAGHRDEVLALIARVAEVLAAEQVDGGPAEPPTLVYALH